MSHEPDDDADVVITVETVEADYCMVDICDHGYGLISFFWEGREKPFAVAHIGPDAVSDMTRYFLNRLSKAPKGTA